MRNSLVFGIIGISLLTLSACTSVPPVAEIPAAIANASTPADHQRIADYFAKKAESYDAEAIFHEKMGKSYLGRNNNKSEPASWVAHCNALKLKFNEAAQEARALEQAHRQLAGAK